MLNVQSKFNILAKVRTNLLSALPWIGQDFVQFVFIFIVLSCLFIQLVSSLPAIGNINWRALRGRKPLEAKIRFLYILFPFLAMVVGLIDGDGYIAVTKKAKGYIEILLVLALDIRDMDLLTHIRGGATNLRFRSVSRSVRLIINWIVLVPFVVLLLVVINLWAWWLSQRYRKHLTHALSLFFLPRPYIGVLASYSGKANNWGIREASKVDSGSKPLFLGLSPPIFLYYFSKDITGWGEVATLFN